MMTVRKQARKKVRKFTRKMQKTLLGVFLVVAVALIALSVVLIRINLNKGEDYSKAVYNNFSYDSRTIKAKRGDITDRNGTILAYSIQTYNVILDTKILLSKSEYREPTVSALLRCFPDIVQDDLNSFINENVNKETKSSYKRILTGLSAEETQEFQTLMASDENIKGVWFESEYMRRYPYGVFAADALGFASEANGGEIGLERYYNSYLSGTDGRIYGYINDNAYVSETINPTNGNTIVSTIDYSIQNIVEESIREFNEEYGSLTTTVVVMDPHNGEILAMADYPTFDLNAPRDLSAIYTEEELARMKDTEIVDAYYKLWSNYSVSSIFEPGSVFKSYVIAAAIEEGLIHENDIWTCDGEAVYNGATIHCHGGYGHGDITTVGALALSCNDALMQIGEKLGIAKFSEYLRNFQFGYKTDVDLPGEEQGLVINESSMMEVDLATNSFGQNINVNMLQMMSSFASLINGGYYYEPHLVKSIKNTSGDVVKNFGPTLISKTVSEDTSKKMRQYFRATVDFGTPMIVSTPGYSIGGKTGTAQKAGRLDDSYIVSFMGFMTEEDPQYLVYVVIDSPQIEEYYNSSAAQMVFRSIFKKLTLYYGISMGYEDYWLNFKIYADDEEYRVSRPYDPNNVLTTPIPPSEVDEDDRIDSDTRPEEPEDPENPGEAPEEQNGASPGDEITPPENNT